MVSPIGRLAPLRKSAATSEPFPAISLSVVSIIKNVFCAPMVKKVSMTTPMSADTIAAPLIVVEKLLKR